jgi:hypothetical protein
MPKPVQNLPEHYSKSREIDLSANKGLLVLLNLIGLILFGISFALLTFLSINIHPGLQNGFDIGIKAVVLIIGLMIIMLLTHEAIHGFFFWRFTHARPVFALRLTYAYAAAPDWFIPANQYQIVGLAPLVIIDLVCVLLILIAPASWALPAAFVTAMNTAGAIGDLWIIFRLSREIPGTFIQDTGNKVSFFAPQRKES